MKSQLYIGILVLCLTGVCSGASPEELLKKGASQKLSAAEWAEACQILQDGTKSGTWPQVLAAARANKELLGDVAVVERACAHWGRDGKAAGLSAGQLMALVQCLRHLGAHEAQTGSILQTWCKGRDLKQEQDVDRPAAQAFFQDGTGADGAMKAVVVWTLGRLKADLPPEDPERIHYVLLLGWCVPGLSAEEKARACEQLKTTYLNADSLHKLSLSAAFWVAEAWANFETARDTELLAAWIKANTAWRKERVRDLAKITYMCAIYAGGDKTVGEVKTELGPFLWSQCFATGEALARVPQADLPQAALLAARALSKEQRQTLGEVMIDRFFGAKATEPVSAEYGMVVRDSLANVAGGDGVAHWVAAWMGKSTTWQDVRQVQTVTLLEDLQRSSTPDAQAKRKTMEQHILDYHLRNDGRRKAMPIASAIEFAFRIAQRVPRGEAEQLAVEFSERLAAAPPSDLRPFQRLSMFMSQAQLTGRGKGHGPYAQALGVAIAGGAILQDRAVERAVLAEPIRSDEARNALAAAVIKPDQKIALEGAYVLAWAYEKDKLLPQWRAQIEKHLKDDKAAADARASWLAAQAFADAVAPPGMDYPKGLSGLKQALAAAESEDLRLQIVEEMMWAYVGMRDFQIASTALQSLKGQFPAARRARIEQAEQQVQQAKASAAAEDAANKARAAAVRRKGAIADLRQRLETARKNGNQKLAGELEANLQALEHARD